MINPWVAFGAKPLSRLIHHNMSTLIPIPTGRPKFSAEQANYALLALSDGVFDNPCLLAFGPLHADAELNRREIAACAGLLPTDEQLGEDAPAGEFAVGDVVVWTDPDDGLCTRTGVLSGISYRMEDDSAWVSMTDGWESEVMLGELSKPQVETDLPADSPKKSRGPRC
jgi:hypothetical protein